MFYLWQCEGDRRARRSRWEPGEGKKGREVGKEVDFVISKTARFFVFSFLSLNLKMYLICSVWG